LITLLLHLLIPLRLEVFFGVSKAAELCVLIRLNHRAHQSLCDILLVQVWLFITIYRALACHFQEESHHLVFLANYLVSLEFSIQIFEPFHLLGKHEVIVSLRISLSE
jgi:hypothetical protein